MSWDEGIGKDGADEAFTWMAWERRLACLAGVATYSVESRAAQGMTVAERPREVLLRRWLWTRELKRSGLQRHFGGRSRRLGVFHSVVLLRRTRECWAVYGMISYWREDCWQVCLKLPSILLDYKLLYVSDLHEYWNLGLQSLTAVFKIKCWFVRWQINCDLGKWNRHSLFLDIYLK